jgi:hypothetical protein
MAGSRQPAIGAVAAMTGGGVAAAFADVRVSAVTEAA